MKNRLKMAALSFSALLIAPGVASAQTFDTTGGMDDHGIYGNDIYFKPTDAASALQLRVTGWQSKQSNGVISKAWVGAYGAGLGVTGTGDYSGNYGYHQIDNAGDYTDFVLLQFSAPVALKSLTLNSFTMGSATVKDNDMAFYAASVPELRWNSAIDLTGYTTVPTLWTTIAGTGKDGVVSAGSSFASKEWLVGAAFNSASNDGFKIASITVAPSVAAVPEPASWAMMMLGVGAVGSSLRGRRVRKPAGTPARA